MFESAILPLLFLPVSNQNDDHPIPHCELRSEILINDIALFIDVESRLSDTQSKCDQMANNKCHKHVNTERERDWF